MKSAKQKDGTAVKKPRDTKTISWPVALDATERKLITDLKTLSGGVLTVSQIQRAAVRYAVPKFLSGEVPVSGALTLVPDKTTPV